MLYLIEIVIVFETAFIHKYKPQTVLNFFILISTTFDEWIQNFEMFDFWILKIPPCCTFCNELFSTTLYATLFLLQNVFCTTGLDYRIFQFSPM